MSADARSISQELHAEIHRRVAAGESVSAIRKALHLSNSTISKYRALPLADAPVAGATPTQTCEVKGDSMSLAIPRTDIHTLEALLEFFAVDTDVWEVERFICNKWEGMFVTEEIRHGTKKDGSQTISKTADKVPLYQVKAFLKRKRHVVDAQAEIAALKELAKAGAPKPSAIKLAEHNSKNLLEINLPDTHFGKMAWGLETGWQNYDVPIAAQVFWRALESLLARVEGHKFDQVLFVVGNDLLNSDDIEGRTTSGTNVSTDGRYKKTFDVVRKCIVQAIERLRLIAPVKVVMVPGNHDSLSVWHLGDSLECYFHRYTDVEIDNTPPYRKYHRFGNVMLMFTHGDKAKRMDYPLLMATEQSQMFGETKFREAHTGHNHTTRLEEQHGVRVRILPALCAPDDWHAENGYVGNMQSAEAYIWNAVDGLIGIAYYHDDRLRPGAAA